MSDSKNAIVDNGLTLTWTRPQPAWRRQPRAAGPEATIELLALSGTATEPARATPRAVHSCAAPVGSRAFAAVDSRSHRDQRSRAGCRDRSMGPLDAFEARYQGRCRTYLRMAVRNRIRDVIRKHSRQSGERGAVGEPERRSTHRLNESSERERGTARRRARAIGSCGRQAIVGRIEMPVQLRGADDRARKPTPPPREWR